ncbi:MAG: sporulation integral membrane protein YtvI [Oscillospiraceae bacterium]|jgi:sporulation integral membrane protein YtvI|nr:sporulation integral membrane protein YtvI [Oscillospiraceae bacterium]
MNETIESRRRFILNTAYFALVVAIFVLAARFLVPWLMPFLLGYAIAMLFKPVVRFLVKHSKVGEKFAGCVIVLLGYALLAGLIFIGGYRLVIQLTEAFTGLPRVATDVVGPGLNALSRFLNDTLGGIFPDIAQSSTEAISVTMEDLQSTLISVSTTVLTAIGGLTAKIPSFLLSCFFTIMSSLIISMNYQEITAFLVRQIPENHRKLFFRVKDDALTTVGKYLIAYIKIMGVTFLELSAGFLFLRVPNSILVALGIAVFDALPILGTGGVMIPWIALTLLVGDYPLALGLAILYAIVSVVRNIIEPRIIGNQLGLNPLVTLMAIFIGFKLFGVIGMIISPIIFQIITGLHRSGVIRLWR